jgi:Domain of unknown function (DUF4406)
LKLYLCGPMSNLPQFNFPAFDEAAAALRAAGHMIVAPHEHDSPEYRAAALASATGSVADVPAGETWGTALARDVRIITDEGIEGIVYLPGWYQSRGARLETFVALLCNIDNFYYYERYFGSKVMHVPTNTIRDIMKRHMP